MDSRNERVVPLHIDLSALVSRSVATLYSHLVTRPTGEALRLGIERQISDLGSVCLSVLDFTQVVVLDYSCADEMIAKLLHRYRDADRTANVYFLARAVDENHRQTIEAVLGRYDLALVAELTSGVPALLGSASAAERRVWTALERLSYAPIGRVSDELDAASADSVRDALDRLVRRRVALRASETDAYASLGSLLGAD